MYAFRNVLQRTQENGKISEIVIYVEFKLVVYSSCMFLCEVWVLTAMGLDIQTSGTLCYVDW